MNIADSFYIALCMTVLLIGVVYWFWTQTQFLQRKMNLLENIVYELKTLVDHGPHDLAPRQSGGSRHPSGLEGEDAAAASALAPAPDASASASAASAAPSYPPPPGSEFGEDDDLLHEQLHAATEGRVPAAAAAAAAAAATEGPKASPRENSSKEAVEITEFSELDVDAVIPDDLQPGGVGSGLPTNDDSSPGSPFAETRPRGNVLDGMTLKELRRLAEQRNIVGASTMRKQAIIDVLRSDAKPVDEEHRTESKITLSEETTLSLQ